MAVTAARPLTALLSTGVLAATAAIVLAAALGPTGVFDLATPTSYDGSAVFHAAVVKALGAGDQATLLAPGGIELGAYRLQGAGLNLVLLVLIARLVADPIVALNIFVLMTLGLASAVAAVIALRLGAAMVVSISVGVLYAFLPLHFDLASAQPLLSALWGVPIAVYLSCELLSGLADRDRMRPVAAAILGVVVVASGWLVAVTAIAAVALAAALGALGRGWRPLAVGLTITTVMVLATAVLLAVDIGSGAAAPNDVPTDVRATEIAAPGRLTLADLILPRQGHRLTAAAGIRDAYDAREPNGDPSAALGLAATIGLMVLAGVLVGARLGRPPGLAERIDWRLSVWVLGLIGVFGSGGVLRAAATVFPPVDRWTPVAAFVGFAGLLATASLVQRALGFTQAGGRNRGLVAVGLVIAVTFIGVLDQTAPASRTKAEIADAVARDEALDRRAEDRFEPGAMIFQLPVVDDPALSTQGLAPYELLRPSIHTDQLRWSATLGPPPEWQRQIATGPARLMPIALSALSFDALVVHRSGYADGGAAIEATLRSVLDVQALEGFGEGVAVFDLRPVRQRVNAAYGVGALERVARDLVATGSYDAAPFDARLELVADGLVEPVGIVELPDGSGRLAVPERAGIVRIIERDGTIRREPLLDLRDEVGTGVVEQGLLGLAFHPDFATNGRLFIHYTEPNDDAIVAEFELAQTSAGPVVDPQSSRELFRVTKPSPYHNGGQLLFGPDGYLYASFGDGVIDFPTVGPVGTGQDRSSLRGSIVRVDVDRGDPYGIPPDNPLTDDGGRPETWVYGLRNPWRFSFDSATRDMFIGDVGQLAVEEVDIQRANSRGGENYGWREMMGSSCFEEACDPSGFVAPLYEYAHGDGRCAVTGGYVYRGRQYDDMYGLYIFGDLCSGQIWSLDPNAPGTVAVERIDTDMMISTFGQRNDGELLVADFAGGAIYALAFPPGL